MKKRKVIIAICVVLVVILAVTGIAFAVSSNDTEPDFTIETISSEYFEADDSAIASVNGKEVTEKDVILAKYAYHEANSPFEKAIEHSAMLQLVQKEGFEQKQSSIDNAINDAKRDCESLNLNSENEEDAKLCEELQRSNVEAVLVTSYRGSLERKISNHEFVTDNKKINKKYEKYKRLDDKWRNGNENEDDWSLFTKNWLLMEEIADDYINAEIEKMNIERY